MSVEYKKYRVEVKTVFLGLSYVLLLPNYNSLLSENAEKI